MIRIFAFILFSFLTLLVSNIFSYNIYDRTDRVDVMLTFDTPYHGKILKSRYNSKIVLKLYDAKIESSKIKHLSSRFLKSLSINPMDGYTQIVASVPTDDIVLKASKTADAYGLRLRFVKKSALSTASQIKQQAAQTTPNAKLFPNLPTKQSNDISTSYYIVVTLLLIAVVIMLLLKKKLANKTTETKQTSSWLFKSLTPKAPAIKAQNSTLQSADEVSIRFQKRLDEHNSVVMLDFQNQSYLILLGEHNNILLEKFQENIPTTQSEFESMLAEKNSELDAFLKVEQQPSSQAKEEVDLLRTFSNKASNTPYE